MGDSTNVEPNRVEQAPDEERSISAPWLQDGTEEDAPGEDPPQSVDNTDMPISDYTTQLQHYGRTIHTSQILHRLSLNMCCGPIFSQCSQACPLLRM